MGSNLSQSYGQRPISGFSFSPLQGQTGGKLKMFIQHVIYYPRRASGSISLSGQTQETQRILRLNVSFILSSLLSWLIKILYLGDQEKLWYSLSYWGLIHPICLASTVRSGTGRRGGCLGKLAQVGYWTRDPKEGELLRPRKAINWCVCRERNAFMATHLCQSMSTFPASPSVWTQQWPVTPWFTLCSNQ